MRATTLLVAVALGAAAALAEEAGMRSVRWQAAREHDPFGRGLLGVAQVTFDGAKAMVRCSSRPMHVEVRFFLERRLVTSSGSVTWQFDFGRSSSSDWGRSPNGRSLIVPASIRDRFIENLKTYNTIVLRLEDGDGARHDVLLPLRGSSAAIDQAMAWCLQGSA